MSSTSAAMASASSGVRVNEKPKPLRMPPWLKLPGKTVMMFWPSEATWASTWALAPLPMLTIVMTAPTPMMMPSAVRIDRMVLRRRARRATRIIVVNRMAGGRQAAGETVSFAAVSACLSLAISSSAMWRSRVGSSRTTTPSRRMRLRLQ